MCVCTYVYTCVCMCMCVYTCVCVHNSLVDEPIGKSLSCVLALIPSIPPPDWASAELPAFRLPPLRHSDYVQRPGPRRPPFSRPCSAYCPHALDSPSGVRAPQADLCPSQCRVRCLGHSGHHHRPVSSRSRDLSGDAASTPPRVGSAHSRWVPNPAPTRCSGSV